ncbi:MAG: superoxide dismutase family protein [Caulobacter sp.]|nr:superoxide dismutase family protein [Caulobacter sp.]
MRLFPAVLVAAAVALPAFAAPAPITVALKGPKGEDLGTATVTEGARGVLVRVEAKGLTPGWHGLHFHEKGDCSSADFKSAGGHVHDATPVTHGFLAAGSNDGGDLPNIFAGADGVAKADVFTTFVELGTSHSRPSLLDADGSAVVIHAKADDYASQPIGGAGDRVACGVIKGG